MSFSSANIAAPFYAPTQALRNAGVDTRLFQGCAYAIDPTDKKQYLFQLQAVRVGPGDIEHLAVHRFLTVGISMLKYLDSMTIEQGGHVQSGHCRITVAGTPYLWLGLENYTKTHVQDGKSLYRVRYTPNKTIKKNTSACKMIYTGSGSVDAVGCPDWTIVLRRGGSKSDRFEWHREKALLDTVVQKEARKGNRPQPVSVIDVLKSKADDDYQSALAQGAWNSGEKNRVFRLTGARVVHLTNSDYPGEMLDITTQAMPLFQDQKATVEPEGAFTKDGLLHVAVQCGSAAKREIAYIPLSW